jgi:hypothetical protein
MALKPNGILVLDYMNSEKVCDCLMPEEVKEVDGIRFRVRKKVENRKIIKQISFSDKGKSFSFEEHLGIFTLEDFEKLFSKHPLKITNTFGDYSLNAFDETSSDRLILIAQKQQA